MKDIFKAFIMSLSMFSIIPAPYIEWDENGSRNMMKCYPIIGLIIGVIWSIIYFLLSFADISIVFKSVVLTITPFILTGMLHLDGYMDVCDAVLSRRSREEKLRILKDSTTGAFAVIAVIILFFLQFGTLHSILEKYSEVYKLSYALINDKKNILCSLILIPVISRSMAAYYILTRRFIKQSSMGSYFKKGTNKLDIVLMQIYLAACLIILGIVLGLKFIFIPVMMALVMKAGTEKCRYEFGGMSGDVAGFILVIGELTGLITVALL